MVSVATDFISVGGNRHPGAADWDTQSGVLAYGADNNVALWKPEDKSNRGVFSLLVGHEDKVSAVRFLTFPETGTRLLLTGSVDRTIRIWKPNSSDGYYCACTLIGHTGTINAIAVGNGSNIVASGGADGTARIWRLDIAEDTISAQCLQTISMKPRFFPLALALLPLDLEDPKRPMLLSVGGTTNHVHIYATQNTAQDVEFVWGAKLSGHEAWIRSLAFKENTVGTQKDFILASASQDKYIRLWRIHRGEVAPIESKDEDEMVLGGDTPTLSNKAYIFNASGSTYSVTFEALLLGHEDWIYTANWNPNAEKTQLLSASADNSLTIWEPDPTTGVWVTTDRMGEISSQKGSTSATGSTGGFWIGLWSPDGKQVVSLARTGSWRAWYYDEESDFWQQKLGVTGHVRSVNDIQWEARGAYLLSTSSDQTSRLYAEWLRDGSSSWHEFSRPQIHGYDLNCLDTLGPARFVSGADEKLLRVFNEPKQIAQLLEKLCDITPSTNDELPETANIPVLGLSNKAAGEDVTIADNEMANRGKNESEAAPPIALPMHQPPLEDYLARHTLWPEHEKLYGHGYEISAVAVSHDRSLIATACKASSIDHAVIRLYDTRDWHEIKPSLTAHSLTITSLCFSETDNYLLSVGRDRQFAVFKRDEADPLKFTTLTSNPKAHSRMILGAAWAPIPEPLVFATAGRDKSVKLWQMKSDTFECVSTISLKSAVTSLSFCSSKRTDILYLAAGEETGQISIHEVSIPNSETRELATLDKAISPSKAITQLAWRPDSASAVKASVGNGDLRTKTLATASEDSSVRIYRLADLPT
ncbi:putative RNA polymerase II Elongator subunit [Talaromyces proteolyticus]|uniref:Elongator complex protein 2 n=1 Tax=Talaromyces proteolyticus TaxID=1131652 RepID=A0AAD4KE38_9EURO|nr:putative RNA polymerase II Elongator subunit [Talaromyces proteolyticus]KAH8689689.1 putative RNA polymerase II Elongator subunit [Talaromyces proteolyticus]